MSRRPQVAVLYLAAITLLVGCGGPKTYPVNGKIVFKGDQSAAEELAGFTVTMETADHDPTFSATGTVQADGTFVVGTFEASDGAVEGRHRAALTPPMELLNPDAPQTKPVIDSKYGSFETSGLEVTVLPEPNQITIEVVQAE